jgi:CheY-like chemotaxis protein
MKILLVEDNVRLSELVKKNLEKDHFVVDIASNLVDADVSLSTYQFDLIILDLNLPDGNGEEYLNKLRKKKNKIPVIILTANNNFDTKIKNLNIGADDFLTKPFKHEELVARIHASNPKAILFFAALFPQFISVDGNIWIQFLILSLTYITIDGIFLTTYGLGASYIVSFIKKNTAIWVNRIGGVLMLITAILLGLRSIKDN